MLGSKIEKEVKGRPDMSPLGTGPMTLVPAELWTNHILSRVSLSSASHFGRSCRRAQTIFQKLLARQFNYMSHDVKKLLGKVKEAGVKIDWQIIYRIARKPMVPRVLRDLVDDEDNCVWAIAAICGDTEWLNENWIKNGRAQQLCSKGRSLLYYSVYGGHCDYITNKLAERLPLAKLTDDEFNCLYQLAGRMGYFNICDILEAVKPITNQMIKDGETKAHYYALHGKLYELVKMFEKYPDLKNIELLSGYGYFVHYAIIGGQMNTFVFLAGYRGTVHHLRADIGLHASNALDVAVENEQVEIARLLLTEYNFEALEEDTMGEMPIHKVGETGNWDMVLLLYPYYKQEKDFKEIMQQVLFYAVERNHVDFVDQFVLRFGVDMLCGVDKDGKGFAHYLLSSFSVVTVRHLLDKYQVDLFALNEDGEAAILYIARACRKFNESHMWRFIAEFVNTYDQELNGKLWECVDKKGRTLMSWIQDEKNDRSYLFDAMNQSSQLEM